MSRIDLDSIRPRRLRENSVLREMIAETRLHSDQLIAPLFVKEGLNQDVPVATMPGVFQHALKNVGRLAKQWHARGIRAMLIFGIPRKKDATGSGASSPQGIVQNTVRAIKSAVPAMCVITDVCLCEYTSHGHCGVLRKEDQDAAGDSNRSILLVDNAATLPLLAQTAVSLARAGADIIAPSDMMDGRVRAIRSALDAAGFQNTPIMSYAVKYASALYGPFRDAAENAPTRGDRRSYQMDPANADEALREIQLDESEGADMLIVKPATFYLDVIRRVCDATTLPVIGYQVSGEYSMLRAAITKGWLDEKLSVLESLLCIRRAGARLVISYFAPQVMTWL